MQQLMISLMERFGYPGVFFLIAIENIFPPIPSEVILTFGGFLTTRTALHIPGVVLFATLGALAGAMVLYEVGRILDKDRLMKLVSGSIGKFLCLKPADVQKADEWFSRKGKTTVFFCRLIPVVRSLISIPAGMSHMEPGSFLLYTTAGSAIWNLVLVFLGAKLGESWELIAYYAHEYANIVKLILLICLVSGGIWFCRSSRRKKTS